MAWHGMAGCGETLETHVMWNDEESFAAMPHLESLRGRKLVVCIFLSEREPYFCGE